MKYWFPALLGVVLSAAAVAVVAWCTYAWTRVSLCTPADTQLACRLDGQSGVVIAVAIFVAIPLASWIFTLRQRNPRGTPLGLLSLGLALTAAGGAALWSALGSGAGTDAEIPSVIVAGCLLSIGPFFLLAGIAVSGRRGEATRATRAALIAANGGDVGKAFEAMRAARAGTSVSAGWSGVSAGSGGGAGRSATAGSGTVTDTGTTTGANQLGALAAQLSQIAAARERTGGDAIATSLRQLDDLRASGLLTPEEHARKRREILDKL
ncbi:SHOCT domain-containing protein [Conexibacter sp. CPCC 206217]|uniref:SHOCT domain-containing protein n=1 Tax=Conexibacter sp. CPCC 206217 TaxID=3064574 RepID=UPI002725B8B7|nr:SHOCT domain-containing protein [Conexibacter sp. CPCC 206217]MDO8213716.1 SHOCT domain-containing protein [Conexibacter sp. CPCC 206217]